MVNIEDTDRAYLTTFIQFDVMASPGDFYDVTISSSLYSANGDLISEQQVVGALSTMLNVPTKELSNSKDLIFSITISFKTIGGKGAAVTYQIIGPEVFSFNGIVAFDEYGQVSRVIK